MTGEKIWLYDSNGKCLACRTVDASSILEITSAGDGFSVHVPDEAMPENGETRRFAIVELIKVRREREEAAQPSSSA